LVLRLTNVSKKITQGKNSPVKFKQNKTGMTYFMQFTATSSVVQMANAMSIPWGTLESFPSCTSTMAT
jgi:hypothetical protein